jgi:hypothetical protein|tara:strand:- start:126 stop:356 length:231 start_codon:yes stop_codon:yes gene_type:complete
LDLNNLQKFLPFPFNKQVIDVLDASRGEEWNINIETVKKLIMNNFKLGLYKKNPYLVFYINKIIMIVKQYPAQQMA